MHILVGGGTGFVGRHLTRYLRGRGHTVTAISRYEGPERITWQQLRWDDAPADVDAIVNLAGNRFWDRSLFQSTIFASDSAKERFQTSRWTTAKMCQLFCEERAAEGRPLKAYVQGSSILYYHCNTETEEQVWTEADKGGFSDRMNSWIRQWEESSLFTTPIPTRHVIIRNGNVLHPSDGFLRLYCKKFVNFVGGPLQYGGHSPLPWIHVDDACGLITFALESDHVNGVLNGVAPDLVTHKDICLILGQKLKRPNWFSVPVILQFWMNGPDRTKHLLESPWIRPERTLSMGYHFRYGDLRSALTHLLDDAPPSFWKYNFEQTLWRRERFLKYWKSWYLWQQYVVVQKWNPSELIVKCVWSFVYVMTFIMTISLLGQYLKTNKI